MTTETELMEPDKPDTNISEGYGFAVMPVVDGAAVMVPLLQKV